MTIEDIQIVDRSNFFRLLVEFPQQVEDAVRIARAAEVKLNVRGIQHIIITGLGGSAIGGDLLRSYLADQLRIPIFVNRHYSLPEFVSQNSLAFVSSYSGNTEETIAAHREAKKRKARIVCISSEGELASMAKRYGHSFITIPPGFPPRAALGYSFFPMLITLNKLRLAKANQSAWKETVSLLKALSERYKDVVSTRNLAIDLAYRLKGKLPILYSSTERFDSVNLRWRAQLAENAKVLAFGNVLPEMNHNEVAGWHVLKDLMKNMAVIILRDRDDHLRVQKRMDITKDIIGECAASITEVQSEGRSVLARMFSLVYLGDWVSFYLAILNGVDPTSVKVIDYLKLQLAKV
ncbi:MAG: bifunctional phosphoglucose/phosphomannose isomerase [Bacteroidota bacterium]